MADYFMQRPLFGMKRREFGEQRDVLCRLVDAASDVDARGVDIPFLGKSSITTAAAEEDTMILVRS